MTIILILTILSFCNIILLMLINKIEHKNRIDRAKIANLSIEIDILKEKVKNQDEKDELLLKKLGYKFEKEKYIAVEGTWVRGYLCDKFEEKNVIKHRLVLKKIKK